MIFNFLRKIQGFYLAAAVSFLLALGGMWWLYGQEFSYPNTDAGRLAAVEAYIPMEGETQHVEAGTPLHVLAWKQEGSHLFISYKAGNPDNVHGILHLIRGINGKYMPVEADYAPFPFTAGVYAKSFSAKGMDENLYLMAGDGCGEIRAARVRYAGYRADGEDFPPVTKTYEIAEPDFLWGWNQEEMSQELGIEGADIGLLYASEIQFLDSAGRDVTDQYRDSTVESSWGAGKSTAEIFMLYVFIGIIGVMGILFTLFFLSLGKRSR